MTVECCPICHGNGLVSAGFYSHPGDYPIWVTSRVASEKCRSCDGRGYIIVVPVVEIPNTDDTDQAEQTGEVFK